MTQFMDSPLRQWLSFEATETSDGRLYSMTPGDAHVGNPLIKALHGGVVSTFLELAALHELKRSLGPEANASAINTNVDYLKSVRPAPLFAGARIVKAGRRLVFVDCAAWQDDENSPAAKAACSFALSK